MGSEMHGGRHGPAWLNGRINDQGSRTRSG